MAKFAAALLEAHEDDLVFENGTISVKGSPASGEVVRERRRATPTCRCRCPKGSSPGLSDEAFFEPTNNTYPFGCHISMLEIDRETGEPTLLKLVAVDDAGNLINPLIVEGQIHGGLAQGIGQAMIEEVVYSEDGQLLTGSFMDYAHPARHRFPALRARRHRDADAGEPARRERRRRSRHARLDAVHRRRGGRRAQRVRREAHRHDAAARKAVAHHPGRPVVISTTFEYSRATSLDDALAKLRAANGDGEADRRRPQPGPADEAAPERARRR